MSDKEIIEALAEIMKERNGESMARGFLLGEAVEIGINRDDEIVFSQRSEHGW